MADEDEELLDRLESVWDSMARLGDTLSEPEWKTLTECPGWTVQDCYAHIIGIEATSMGRPEPQRSPSLDHVKNDLGKSNEMWVDAYRELTGAQLLEEFRAVTGERLASLRAPDADLGADSWTPVGPGTVRDLIPFRIFDSWIHEQDARRAIDRPGGWDSAGARTAMEHIERIMPMVVGKRVAPPDGTTVVFSIRGPLVRALPIGMVDGRARILDEVPAAPTVTMLMDGDTFVRLSSGRGDPHEVVRSVTFEGDAELGERVALQMNFLF